MVLEVVTPLAQEVVMIVKVLAVVEQVVKVLTI
jgi:hypothetical protein